MSNNSEFDDIAQTFIRFQRILQMTMNMPELPKQQYELKQKHTQIQQTPNTYYNLELSFIAIP